MRLLGGRGRSVRGSSRGGSARNPKNVLLAVAVDWTTTGLDGDAGASGRACPLGGHPAGALLWNMGSRPMFRRRHVIRTMPMSSARTASAISSPAVFEALSAPCTSAGVLVPDAAPAALEAAPDSDDDADDDDEPWTPFTAW